MTELNLETIRIDRPVDGVAVVTLDRPDKLNAQNNTMFREIEEIAWALNDEDDLRVVILTGAGRAFCAGFDLDDAKNLPSLGALGMLSQQELAARALLAFRSMRVPVIAAVNGPAAGGGFSLALAADIRIASPSAKFNAAFVRIGLTAGDLGVSWLLPRLVGPAVANEIAFTGALVDAEEAERIGLVNKVVGADALMDECLAMAALICANSPGGVQLSKRALMANQEVASYAAAIELENRGQALLTRSPDMPESLAAFLEKRAPKFTGA
ncbi:enoyl-CoA hydratase/isomerase family protein [Janibacter sp. YIM B02568]|uniref:enoyl-CoA hydratase/isomerase family protein n=1 Tax=Janibacter endophyticus TaxID=2806261 RepID=UPI00194E9B75|nr:enoyl-CoA hydratase-related protein [Janibacter endophyticus]MBM6545440.1 enoyl-CoA hydratase/isomerase family protein [Janibacter endophyticus]